MNTATAIRHKKGSVAVLDIGTSKVACFIAEPDVNGELHITGMGHQVARGMRAGLVTDPAELEASVIGAVHSAEQMAGATIENVVVNVSGAHLVSHAVTVQLTVPGDGVSERDIADILREGCLSVQDKNRSVVHCFAVQYSLDGARGIRDPRGMYGSTLGADLHIITAENARLRNLAGCVARAHLNVGEFVVASHASALSCLEADEMDLGVLHIDIGGGETCFSVFHGGVNIYCDVIPIGGQHVTSDIAVGLSTSIANAERLKSLHGSAMAVPQDNQVMIDIPQMGEEEDVDGGNLVPRAMLIGIIRPRYEEIFEMIRAKLEASGVYRQAGRTAVLTGGASQLLGIRELASQVLGKHVRLGRPSLMPGLADSVSGPAFATIAGTLRYISNRPLEDSLFESSRKGYKEQSRLQRLVQWMKDNF